MKTFGLIGKNLSHSFSKKYFNNKFYNEDIKDCEYKNFELNHISEINNLTQEQLDEIWIYSEDEDCEKWIGMALRSLIQEFMET